MWRDVILLKPGRWDVEWFVPQSTSNADVQRYEAAMNDWWTAYFAGILMDRINEPIEGE